MPSPFARIPMSSTASEEFRANVPPFDGDKVMLPRSVFECFARLLQLQFVQDTDIPFLGAALERKYDGWLDYITSPLSPPRPRNYVDAYIPPNPCPEKCWWASWRWPRTKYVNAKVPSPVDGK
ncbi:hypothetical protein TraAM80_08681 [Trypanosoma rangeli]|uniref:Uncharacterized protein n=1 Tax=Trypanosoma rangeli TaxID=5698 RepID=A0A3R7JXW3_TRYRA|nr:uncharacterized protein TraAM80_08681 [Trypanosoma rangeli]RNE98613.1 hypothetical protein TraAM80_08681 [Trypanosoma rangeli]|eukprot:RNE98613.1 hypothetical protein TraAM80_08681 [Trypanosoma rangeli]